MQEKLYLHKVDNNFIYTQKINFYLLHNKVCLVIFCCFLFF